jgi:hypothetical protein
MNFKKGTLYYFPTRLLGQVDDYEGSCAMTLVTTNVDKLARPANADAVKKYFVKNTKKKSSISCKPEKAA